VKVRQTGAKVSIYIPAAMVESLTQEARRQDRSVSWLLRKAWHVAQPTVAKLPGVPQS
jgi:uncharacterized small protein (TIGR04563 family)